ncbi:MAG: sulfite exporter TauE/SafE family protein, partial [Cyclobacteriaceae bacterium]|nr:sulfite exporter TauE/SafE family protein [Cyclobacteriaceae bacterium]
GVPAVLFVIIGAYLSKFIETAVLEIMLAIFLVAISLLFLFVKKLELKPTLANSIGGGVLAGLLAGLLGTGGAIRGITLAAFHLKMNVFIATSAVIDLAIDVSRSVVYSWNGFVHRDDLYLVPILLVVSVVGTYIGKRILLRISEEQFKKIVLVLVLATGVSMLIRLAW